MKTLMPSLYLKQEINSLINRIGQYQKATVFSIDKIEFPI